MENNYFFIDGSALLGDIARLKKKSKELVGRKFEPLIFAHILSGDRNLAAFHNREYRRFVFYFVKGDDRVKEQLNLPNFAIPGLISDIHFKYCGKKVVHSKYAKVWLEKHNAPLSVTDSLHKSEKAVDTQICCDALMLLAVNKLDRLFLYSNDYDFIPLCQTVKALGANINLIQLSGDRVNKKLAAECDAFNTLEDYQINRVFGLSGH